MTEKKRDPRGRHADPARQPVCAQCYNCRTRIFRNQDDLKNWCEENEIEPKLLWSHKIEESGFLRLFWCRLAKKWNPKGIIRPRLALPSCSSGSFIKNCQEASLA